MEYMQWICILILNGIFGTPVEQTNQFRDNSAQHLNDPTSSFKWAHCDKIGSPLKVSYLNIQPDPIILGQELNFTFTATSSKPLGETPVELIVDIKMLIDGSYEEICYFIGDEFCYRPNICEILPQLCPLPKFHFQMKTIDYTPPQPPFLISGMFEATVVLREEGKDLVCVKMWFSVQSSHNETLLLQ